MTLNLTGSSNPNATKSSAIAQSPSSPFAKKFPSTPLAVTRNINTPLVPTPVEIDSQPSSLLLNGASPIIPENVTVTHYSEERGTMEKISVPSMSIFNAEFKADVNDKKSTNPFLNMSPTTSTVSSAPTASTNPFHSSNESDQIEPIIKNTNGTANVASINSPQSKIPVLVSSNTNNGTNVNGNNVPMTLLSRNPFTSISEVDGTKNSNVVKQSNSITSLKRSNSKVKNNNNNNSVNHQNNNSKSSEDKTPNEVSYTSIHISCNYAF